MPRRCAAGERRWTAGENWSRRLDRVGTVRCCSSSARSRCYRSTSRSMTPPRMTRCVRQFARPLARMCEVHCSTRVRRFQAMGGLEPSDRRTRIVPGTTVWRPKSSCCWHFPQSPEGKQEWPVCSRWVPPGTFTTRIRSCTTASSLLQESRWPRGSTRLPPIGRPRASAPRSPRSLSRLAGRTSRFTTWGVAVGTLTTPSVAPSDGPARHADGFNSSTQETR